MSSRQRFLMDFRWKFHRGDIEPPPLRTHSETYSSVKAGSAPGAAGTAFDDSSWRTLDVPHDWLVELAFTEQGNVSQGYKPRGTAWYRRTFALEENDRGKSLSLEFDGVSNYGTVWLNGQRLHRNWCAYTGFSVDISDVARYGAEPNVLAVRVEADDVEGWWYEGGGIYRHVWLVKKAPVHIAQWGAWAKPVRRDGGEWETQIETTVQNADYHARGARVVSTILDAEDAVVGTVASDVTAAARGASVVTQAITVTDPKLWDLDTPHLYALKSEVFEDGVCVDESRSPFGYRHLRFDADRGFFLNDRPVKLKGTCNHQDHAGVGFAVPDSLQSFRIGRLKEMGSNAYRCAHHPPTPELLDACDRLGMLVMDENRHFNSSGEVMDQLRSMVRRDRNHPSVILWSIFNEEPWHAIENGRKTAQSMVHAIRALDDSRPVTAAISGDACAPDGVAGVVDVIGINYAQNLYDACHAMYPAKPILGSENGAAPSTRGIYETKAPDTYITCYDENNADWAESRRAAWKEIHSRDFIGGVFMWAGFDYRGEPAPLEWPCISTHYGVIDTCGFPKDAFYIHKAQWTAEPMLHIFPHWNWPGREGEPIRIMCVTNGDAVELVLNGKSLGRKDVPAYDFPEWQVPYAPGTLKGIAFRDGKPVAECTVATTGPAVAIALEPLRAHLDADGQDAIPVNVKAIDAEGRCVPTAGDRIDFTLEGPARILGVGNGDPTCHEADKANFRSLFNGLCQVILQAGSEPGRITLTATGKGLQEATAALACRAVPQRAGV